MNRYFTKTFVRFAAGFVLIVSASFVTLVLVSHYAAPAGEGVDNLAAPR